MRKQIAAANWKMNLSIEQAEDLMDEILKMEYALSDNQEVLFAVPFPYLMKMKEKLSIQKKFNICAQNCAATKNGAYTGETSAEILKSIDVKYAIIGHSERREYFDENNQLLAQKIDLALASGIKPVFCCGEPLTIREANNQNDYVETQLKESLFHLNATQMKDFIIAYEPIWAIGTGKTASSHQAQEMHLHIRTVLSKQYGNEIAHSISILYGGSVKAANATEIFEKPDVDGGLVGGASLVAAEFSAIINSLKK